MLTSKETRGNETPAKRVPARWSLLLLAVVASTLAFGPTPTGATVYQPLILHDQAVGGCACTLREAVIAANNHPGDDEIRLAAGTYFLSQVSFGDDMPEDGDLDVTNGRLTITGAGGDWGGTAIDAGLIDRAFDIAAGASLTLRGVVIYNGDAKRDPRTGHAHGGAIHNHGELVLEDSALVSNQSAPGWGGGGFTNAGYALLRNVTVAGNTAPFAYGGGIENRPGKGKNSVRLYLQHVTVAENGEGGGIAQMGYPPYGWVVLANTIVAHNLGFDCAYGSDMNATDNYLDSDGTCDAVPAQGVTYLANQDPRFVVTAQGSGTVVAHYPLQTLWPPMGWQQSPAIDAAGSCLSNHDQVGWPRPSEGDGDGTPECDLGASEWMS